MPTRSVLQLILAKAALWDLAQEKARQVRQTNLPQVIRPGTYRASDGDAQSVGELDRTTDESDRT